MLTNREYDVYKIIHSAGKPIISSEIVSRSDMTINTVQAITKKLLKLEVIKVGEIIYSGTVLSRAYVPGDKAPEILVNMFAELYGKYADFIEVEDIIEALREKQSGQNRS
ncbi:MAG: hypothetical protein IJ379_05135 [Lachnospiraceae bacterium]|nr:hypothetical protein [Lachnospiraceae bacterium]